MTTQRDFILLDRSGSMAQGGLWKEALSAVNAYVKKLVDEKVPTRVTLAVFDDNGGFRFDVLRDSVPAAEFLPVSESEAEPRGMTPLNDAAMRLVTMAKQANAEKTAIIIMTDGHENISREHTVHAVRSELDMLRAKGWQVIFLGANFDNQAQATSYGNQSAQTTMVARGKFGLAANAMGATRSAYASGDACMSFTDEQKADLSSEN